MGPRYTVAEVEVGDSNTNVDRDTAIQIGRLNLRLMLERDAGEGYATIGVARVVERRADNKLVLDTQYIPPMMHAQGHQILDGYVRELCGLLHQRGEALAARLSQPGRGGVAEIADFLLLEAVNRSQPVFMQLQQRSVLHPEVLYAACLSLAGDLATFREKRRPPPFPEYLHDDLQRCFRAVMDDLRQSLSMVMEQTAIPIELQDRKYGIRVAIISDKELQRTAMFVLAVAAQIPGEALRARFPTQVKIGPVERIRDLVNLQLPGVTMRPLAGGAAADPVPRRLQLLRARHAQQRAVEAARGVGRAGDAHRRRIPGPRARVLGHPRLGQPTTARAAPLARPRRPNCRKRHERYRTRERSLRRLRIGPHGDQAGHRSRRPAGRARRAPQGQAPGRGAPPAARRAWMRAAARKRRWRSTR